MWGCVKGAASVSLAMKQNTEQERDVLQSVCDLGHADIRKYACGALWDEYGEMKDRFPEHEAETVLTKDKAHNEILQKSIDILPEIQKIVDS
jgi:hypothetical protein